MNFLKNFFGWNNNQAQDRPLFGMVIRNRTDQEPDNISLFALPNNKIASIHDNCKIITIIESGNLQIKQDYIIKHLDTKQQVPQLLINFAYFNNHKYLLGYYSKGDSFPIANVAIGSFTNTEFTLEKIIQNIFPIHGLLKAIPIGNNRIACHNQYESIIIYNCDSEDINTPIATLKGHRSNVSSIIKLKNKDILVSASLDYNFIIWNLSTYQKESVIKGVECSSSNSLLELENGKVIVGGRLSIKIIDITKRTIDIEIINGKLGTLMSFCEMDNNTIICGCSEGMIWKLNPNTKEILKHNSIGAKFNVIHIIKINEKSFVTIVPYNTIKIFDI